MNYYLKKLLKLELVQKTDNQYSLTDIGKDYVNSLDDETKLTEKQPKTSVIIFGVRKNEQNGEIEFLLNRRLEQPYLGKIGRIGGKVRFGERLEDAARRELMEETGLKVESLTLETIYRKIRKRGDVYVQDVIFYVYFGTGFSGELVTKTKFQDNFWVSNREISENPEKYDLYDDLVLEDRLVPKPFSISENTGVAQDF